MPTVFCHPPLRMLASSRGMLRASDRIKPHVSSAVGCRSESVPQTTIPRSAAAFKSIDALTMPVVTRSPSFVRRSHSGRRHAGLGNGVFARERIVKCLYLDAGTQAVPVGHRQRRFLIVVENRKPHIRVKSSDLEFGLPPIYTRLLPGRLNPFRAFLRFI